MTEAGVKLQLASYVAQMLRQAGFAGGAQQDAAECLMHLFSGIDQGQMQSRVCGANAAASVESLILCEFAEEAEAAREAAPVSIACLLQTSLTGDQAIKESVPSLVVRVENIYVRGEEYFAVDARADWASFPIELTVREAPDEHPRYDVAGFVAHISDPTVEPRRRMRSGHYIAYVKFEDVWFELDDSRVTALSAPPARFPYLVFWCAATRADG